MHAERRVFCHGRMVKIALIALAALSTLAMTSACKRRAPAGLPGAKNNPTAVAPAADVPAPNTAGTGPAPATTTTPPIAASASNPSATNAVACLADRLPPLFLQVPDAPQCTADNQSCRDLCITGDVGACFARATATENATNHNEATVLFARACSLGAASGCTNYAAHLWTNAVAASMPCARRLMAAACQARDPYACGMAIRFEVEASDGSAPERQRIAASANAYCSNVQGFACRVLAKFVEDSILETPDPERVRALLEQACQSGDTDSCGKTTAAAAFQ